MRDHKCHATGCTAKVPPKLLMCRKHWAMLPYDLKKAVLDNYRPGQEKDFKVSQQYLAAARRAVNHVRDKEYENAERLLASQKDGGLPQMQS